MVRLAGLVILVMTSTLLWVEFQANTAEQKYSIQKIATVWAGSSARYSAIRDDHILYIGYYDINRRLSVMALDLNTMESNIRRSNIKYDGWDSHNAIEMALDNKKILHIAANMHASPMTYVRLNVGRDFKRARFRYVHHMTDLPEDQVTYPRFYKSNDKLFFMYRQGRSGNGDTYVNYWNGRKWLPVSSTPIFDGENVRNAYPFGPAQGDDGWFHFAWVWRSSPDVADNCCVQYGKTQDFAHWFDVDGTPIDTPVRQNETAMVDDVQPKNGLHNYLKVTLVNNQTPAITYMKYDAAGVMQLFLAVKGSNGWKRSQLSNWNRRWEIGGRGSIGLKIGFSGLEPCAKHVHASAHCVRFEYFDERPSQFVISDLNDLRSTQVVPITRSDDERKKYPTFRIRPDHPDHKLARIPIRNTSLLEFGAAVDEVPMRLIYSAMTGNRDNRIPCSDKSDECYFSELYLLHSP